MNLPAWLRRLTLLALGGCLGAPAAAADAAVRLITLDPGHFHAALFQREMLPGVSPRVHVYAPVGPDLLAHLARIHAFNSRAEQPTAWEWEVHASPDHFARLLSERPGNVVVMSGNSRGKIERMQALVRAGLHVLADKPWIIEPEELPALRETVALARARGVVVYDAMTQRFEISCLLQRELVLDAAVFGQLVPGTAGEPAVAMESVHFLRKEVAGAPLVRPAWFFDRHQQGEPLADVGTHLVDLVQWTLSPERPLDGPRDLAVLSGTREILPLTRAQFKGVTGLADFPASLHGAVRNDRLEFVGRNRVGYTLRGAHVNLDVIWAYEAPPGGKDTELAVFRGTRSRVELRQGREENYVPEVYVHPNRPEERDAVAAALRACLQRLAGSQPGLALRVDGPRFHIVIPAALRVSHEAHFARVISEFLRYQKAPATLPAWEESYVRAKYFITTEGVRRGRQSAAGAQAARLP